MFQFSHQLHIIDHSQIYMKNPHHFPPCNTDGQFNRATFAAKQRARTQSYLANRVLGSCNATGADAEAKSKTTELTRLEERSGCRGMQVQRGRERGRGGGEMEGRGRVYIGGSHGVPDGH
jgi:hypothetical protein